MFYWFFKIICWPVFKIFHRAERVGLENVPKKGPLIVVANHFSFLDPWYLLSTFRLRFIRYMMISDWYYKNIFWKFFFHHMGGFPVTPGKLEVSTMKTIKKIINNEEI